jgi:hypothetical protein
VNSSLIHEIVWESLSSQNNQNNIYQHKTAYGSLYPTSKNVNNAFANEQQNCRVYFIVQGKFLDGL